ncbi:MAG: hypothetical protein ACI85F_002108 [Bacteroidia bacterium]|jgi:hypothetical protein
MKSIVKTLSIIVLILAGMSVFGYLVLQSSEKGAGGSVNSIIREFVSFPDKVTEVLVSNEVRNIPPTFGMKYYFDPINNLERDIYGLNSSFIQDSNHWEVDLFNFKTDSILHTWELTSDRFKAKSRHFPNAEPRNCILLPSRELILGQDETTNLYRLDKNSNIVWERHDLQIHHSMNLDADSNIVICATEPLKIQKLTDNEPLYYEDELIVKISAKSGEIVYTKSVSDLLNENGLRSLIYGFCGEVSATNLHDPLHLNDIQPVLSDGPYWRKNDLFLSFRHISMVILYRPSTNKVIRMIFGPFLRQHDVDILSDSVISIFNNEGTSIGRKSWDEDFSSRPVKDSIFYSNIVQYNFADSSFSTQLKHHFDDHKIYSETQGFHEYLSDGSVYVENHGAGIVFFMNKEEILYKSQLNNWIEDWVERPHWIRIYENVDF